jgi:hypothetical protein
VNLPRVPWSSSVARLVRGLGHEAGLGAVQALDQTRTDLPEGTRARIMAAGFVRGIGDEIELGEAADQARRLVQTIAREARLTIAVLGGCVAGTLGLALLLRSRRRR